MESFFFNITDTRYKLTPLFLQDGTFLNRVDISNGVIFLDANLQNKVKEISLDNLDRMVMIVMLKEGSFKLHDYYSNEIILLKEGNIGIYCSSRQKMRLEIGKRTDVLILFIADFFLKRYLSGEKSEPIDFLYNKIQDELSLEEINRQPIDALSLHIIEKLLDIKEVDRMKSIRAEHRITEFMIHCFTLIDIVDETISEEERNLAHRAKIILLEDFVSPPTIVQLAHLCATNETKLKKVFKKVYKSTLRNYVQKLRLEEAIFLLKEESLTIGEIAKRVGYKHQGYFSKIFFKAYGIYPVSLLKN